MQLSSEYEIVLKCSKATEVTFKDDVTAKVHTNKFGLHYCFKDLTQLEIAIIIIGLCYNVYQLKIIAVFYYLHSHIFLRSGILDK